MRMRRTDDLIEVLMSFSDLEKYNLTVEHMAQHRPFPAKLIEDLIDKASIEYGMEFDIDDCGLRIERYGEMNIYISFSEKSNVIYLENDYIENERIIDGIQGLYRELPDESIYCGIMDVEEKKKHLELMRSEAGREIIRREFLEE